MIAGTTASSTWSQVRTSHGSALNIEPETPVGNTVNCLCLLYVNGSGMYRSRTPRQVLCRKGLGSQHPQSRESPRRSVAPPFSGYELGEQGVSKMGDAAHLFADQYRSPACIVCSRSRQSDGGLLTKYLADCINNDCALSLCDSHIDLRCLSLVIRISMSVFY